MSTFDLFDPPPESLSMVTADYLAALAEHRGRQDLYTRQSPQRLKALRENAIVESSVSSNRIEGVVVEPSRVEAALFGRTAPRDRPEEELRGYRRALDLVHKEGAKLAVSEETILELHRIMRGDVGDAGRYKERTDPIIERYADGRERVRFVPVAAGEAPEAIRRLIGQWGACTRERTVPPPIALAAFNLDFLCIHPFRDGNGRVSRLLLLLMSYHVGFEVGRYISLERLIETDKERYYETLEISSRGWHETRHNPWPFVNFALYTLKGAYREFEGRFERSRIPRGEKTAIVRSAIDAEGGEFTVADLTRVCPGVGVDMIRKVLRDLAAEGVVECIGRGPGAKWRRIAPESGEKT